MTVLMKHHMVEERLTVHVGQSDSIQMLSSRQDCRRYVPSDVQSQCFRSSMHVALLVPVYPVYCFMSVMSLDCG